MVSFLVVKFRFYFDIFRKWTAEIGLKKRELQTIYSLIKALSVQEVKSRFGGYIDATLHWNLINVFQIVLSNFS